MATVDIVQISPADLDRLHIVWEGDPGVTVFEILRGHSELGPFEHIATVNDAFFYLDHDVDLYTGNVIYYYKIRYFDTNGDVQETPAQTALYKTSDKIGQKVIYESRIVLRVIDNPLISILHRKRKGEPCTNCYNPVTKKPRFSNCEVCNGTGWVEGYYKPIKTRVSSDFPQFSMSMSEEHADGMQISPIRAWISNIPLVFPNDIVVDHMNQRYRVAQVQRRTHSHFVIRQILDLVPVDKGSPVYNVDVSEGVTLYE